MYDPKKALRIDRAQKQHRETKKIDCSEMNDYDLDLEDQPKRTRRNNNKKD